MFITFEGPEGSGKTIQARLLAEYLRSRDLPVLLTREPGGTEIGDQIRSVLHDTRNTAMLPAAEILLYSASRAQIVGQVIRPALEAGQIVLCDRYADSTLAYQGYGRRLGLQTLRLVTAFATGGLVPDLTIYLDISVEAGLRRKQVAFQSGQGEWNRMDQQSTDFYRRVREGYLDMAAQEPGRWALVNADRDIQEIHAEVRSLVEKRVGRRR
jgi:dTMP kinase